VAASPLIALGPSDDVSNRGGRATAPLQDIHSREFQPCHAGAIGRNLTTIDKLKLVMPMTNATPHTGRPKRQPKPDKARRVADDIVTPNSLATHLGMTRQNVALLTANAVLVQRSDRCYDQTANRLRYIKHLRDGHQRSPRIDADAEHVKAKTEMLQIKLMEKRKELVKQEEVDALIDNICGVMLTAMSRRAAR
jgi:hypothetical protein